MMSAIMRVVSTIVTATSADSDMAVGCQYQSRDLPSLKKQIIYSL